MTQWSGMAGWRSPELSGGWVELHCLGAGGFGTVMLFENKITHQKLAIKRCRLVLNDQHYREKWKQEIDIMKMLNHPNVVKGLAIPEPLDVNDEDLPLLGMEYCDGGNLRQVLNAAINCCGLKESALLRSTADIASAVQYLHSQRIIHRDIKPENIVISHAGGRTTYKLIDLGYVKVLDQGCSIAVSLVGTPQYLAPELLTNEKYTKTVDFWSFGTVLFECITGMRPFLPELSMIQWHREISKKAADDIWACFDGEGEVKFSKVLPTPNCLSSLKSRSSGFEMFQGTCGADVIEKSLSPLQDKFVALLRLLLLWDPNARGGATDEHKNRECFSLLTKLINCKIIHIFCITTGTLHFFEIQETDSLRMLQEQLHKETGLAVDEQEFILQNGDGVDPGEPVVQCWKELSDDDWAVFLYHKTELLKWPLLKSRPLPQNVQEFIGEPGTCLSYQHLKKVHAYTLHFCREITKNCKILLKGQMATVYNLLKLESTLKKLNLQVIIERHRLEAKIEIFKSSLQLDIEHYSDFVMHFQGNEDMLRVWKKNQKEVESFREKVSLVELEQKAGMLQNSAAEFQKMQETWQREGTAQPLDAVVNEAIKLYEDLRNNTLDKRKLENCFKPCQVVIRCRDKAEKLHKEVYSNMRNILACRRAMMVVISQLQHQRDLLITQQKRLEELQRQRQEDVWKLAFLQEKGVAGLNTSSSTVGYTSVVIVDDNSRSMQRISEMLGTLRATGEQATEDIVTLDWSFLEDSETDQSEEEREQKLQAAKNEPSKNEEETTFVQRKL